MWAPETRTRSRRYDNSSHSFLSMIFLWDLIKNQVSLPPLNWRWCTLDTHTCDLSKNHTGHAVKVRDELSYRLDIASRGSHIEHLYNCVKFKFPTDFLYFHEQQGCSFSFNSTVKLGYPFMYALYCRNDEVFQ